MCKLAAVVTVVMTALFVPLPRVSLGSYPDSSNTSATVPTTIPRLKPAALSLVASGNYYSLAVDGTDLLAQESGKGPVGRSVVVRIDPVDGRILARSPSLYIVDGPAVVTSHIWVVTTSSLRPTHYQLVLLDSRTLQPTRRVAIPATDSPGGFATGSGLLWLNAGCRLERRDPASGAVLARVSFPGGNCQMALGIGDGDLIALSETEEPTGLTVMDGRTGKVLRRLTSIGFMDGSSLAVADGYVWVADSSLTLPGPVYIYRLSDLHLVKTMTERRGGCVSGEAFFGCPGWVEYADGLIWGGGGGSDAIGCASPAALALVATAHGLDGLLDLVSIGGHIYGTYPPAPNYPNNATDVVRFTPPAACDAATMRPARAATTVSRSIRLPSTTMSGHASANASSTGSINFYGKWSGTSLAFPGPSDGFAQVSGSTGTNGWALLERTTDGGRSWQPRIERTAQIYLAFNSPLDGWNYGAAQPPFPSVLQTTNGGRTWRAVLTKGNVFALATSGQVTWMVESFQQKPGGCRSEILRSSGPDKPPRPIANEPDLGNRCDWQVTAATPSVIYLFETGENLTDSYVSYLSTVGGTTWKTQASPCRGSYPSVTLSGVGASLWLTCATGSMLDTFGDRFTKLYRSPNAGRSWHLESSSTGEGSLLVTGRDVAWQWGTSANGLGWLEYTSDGGATWSPRFLASPIVAQDEDTSIGIHPRIVGEDSLQSDSVTVQGNSVAVAVEANWFHNSGITLNHLAVCTTTNQGRSWQGAYLRNEEPA